MVVATKKKGEEPEGPAPAPTPQPQAQEPLEKPVNHAVVDAGDLDSKVLLQQMRNSIPDGNIIEIRAADLPNSTRGSDEDWNKFFKEMKEGKQIAVIHFPGNHEENLDNLPGRNTSYFNKLRQIANDYEISISAPYITVTKDAIEKAAKDFEIEPEPEKREQNQGQGGS